MNDVDSFHSFHLRQSIDYPPHIYLILPNSSHASLCSFCVVHIGASPPFLLFLSLLLPAPFVSLPVSFFQTPHTPPFVPSALPALPSQLILIHTHMPHTY